MSTVAAEAAVAGQSGASTTAATETGAASLPPSDGPRWPFDVPQTVEQLFNTRHALLPAHVDGDVPLLPLRSQPS